MSLNQYQYLIPVSLSYIIKRNNNYYNDINHFKNIILKNSYSSLYNISYISFNNKIYYDNHGLYLLSTHIEDYFNNNNIHEVIIYEYCSNIMLTNNSILQYEIEVEYIFPMSYTLLDMKYKTTNINEKETNVLFIDTSITNQTITIDEMTLKEGLKEASIKVFQANSIQNKLKEKMSSAKLIFNMIYEKNKMVFVLTQIKDSKQNLSLSKLNTGLLFQTMISMYFILILIFYIDRVENNFNMSHEDVFAAASNLSEPQQLEFFGTTMMYLVSYLAKKIEINGDQHLYLKQERAVFLLGSVIWHCKENNINFPDFKKIVFSIFDGLSDKKETQDKLKDIFNSSDYLAFINIFLSLSNALELKDFERCAVPLRPSDRSVSWQGESTSRHTVHSGMRVGISSANASDNWTFAKLMGGQVLNVTINFNEQLKHESTSTDSKCPLFSSVSRVNDSNKLVILESSDSMSGDFGTFYAEFDLENIESLCNTEDPSDRFRMMKFALLFTGIVKKGHVKSDLEKFCKSDCLKLVLRNYGPSRSGFASSSAVATCLLQALYNSSGQFEIANNKTLLGSMVLLFENELGLKSGRQDVDGLLPGGFKLLSYPPQDGFLTPEVSHWNEDSLYNDLTKHFALSILTF